MAHVFVKGDGSHVVVLEVREAYYQPFVAPGWTDLRVGFYLSLTNNLVDDTITGLGETLVDALTGESFWIGFKTRGNVLPGNAGVSFIGFGNAQVGQNKLISSDAQRGTTNTYFWRNTTIGGNNPTEFWVIDNGVTRYFESEASFSLHFPQDDTGAGGYAGLVGIRLVRPSPISNQISVMIHTNVFSADMGFTNTPTKAVLQAALETWPTSVLTLGPYTFNQIPDSVFLYWPYTLSRLRVHSRGILKLVS